MSEVVKNKKRVPEIRFSGFTDDWEQRKLGEVAPLRGGYAFKSSQFQNSGVPIVRIANILSNGSVGGEYSFYAERESDQKYSLPDNARVLAMFGATTGKVAKLTVGPSEKYYQNQRVGFFQPKENTSYDFVGVLVSSNLFIAQLNSVLVAGAQPNISSKEIDGFEFKVPNNLSEQKDIGMIFDNIDDSITLHQRKLDTLRILKKVLLQNLFPKNGEKDPAIRFTGFTDDWEQCKLSEIVERVTRKNKELESTRTLTISALDGLVDQNLYFNKKISSENLTGYILLKKGDFAYNKSYSNGYPLGAIKRLEKYDMGVVSSIYIAFSARNNTDAIFLSSYFETTLWHKGVSSVSTEGARNHGLLNISPADFFTIQMNLPQEIEEQKKIGNLVVSLQKAITLHQRKLNEVESLKKLLLQKMFV